MMNRMTSRLQQAKQRAGRTMTRVNTPLHRRRAWKIGRMLVIVALGILAMAVGWMVFAVVVEIIWGQMDVP